MRLAAQWDIIHPAVDENGYELYHTATPRNATPAFHAHDFYEFYFFISGDASAYIEEFAYRLKPRDVVIFAPGMMHRSFFHQTEAYYERLLVYISAESLRKIAYKQSNLLLTVEELVQSRRFAASLSHESFACCRDTIDQVIQDTAGLKTPHQALINKCRIDLMMALLCGWFEQQAAEGAHVPQSRVAAVIAYINAHLDEPFSLDEMASRFFVSKYYLMHEFKAYTSRTIYQFIQSKRINKAKHLIQMGESPSALYRQCGFNDYSAFYKAFMKEMHLSPKAYAYSVQMRF